MSLWGVCSFTFSGKNIGAKKFSLSHTNWHHCARPNCGIKGRTFPEKESIFFFPSFSCSNHFLGFEPWLSQSFKSSSEDYWGYSLQTPNLDTLSQGKGVSENVTSSENSKTLFVMWKLNRGSDSDLVWVDLIKSHLIFLNIGFLIIQRHNKVYFKGWLQELNSKFSYNVKVQKQLLTLYK